MGSQRASTPGCGPRVAAFATKGGPASRTGRTSPIIHRRVAIFPHLPTPPRGPGTARQLGGAVESLGGEFQDVVISELREHTYFAKLRVRQDGELVEIDSRPSDAIAVAVSCDPPLPIYVSEDVLNDVMGEQQ